MEKKNSFSKLDYYLMFLDDFKDQFTVVILLNIILFLIWNQLDFLYSQMYLNSAFKDFFNEFSSQFVLNDFYKVLGYVYLFAVFVHFGIYKKNIKWLFRFNALILIITSTYVWSIPTFKSIIAVVEKVHIFFILSILTQFLTYIIVGNEFLQLFKKYRKQPEINHS